MPVIIAFIKSVATQILDPILLLLSAGAFVVFVWGVFKFIWNAGDESAREEGRRSILYGLLGLVIIFGAYGILNIVTSSFGLPSVQHLGQ